MFPVGQRFVLFCCRCCHAHYLSKGPTSPFSACPWCGSSKFGPAQFKVLDEGYYGVLSQRAKRLGPRWKGIAALPARG